MSEQSTLLSLDRSKEIWNGSLKSFGTTTKFESVNNLETFGHFHWLYYALLQGIFKLKLKPVIIYSLPCCSKHVCSSFFCGMQTEKFWRMFLLFLSKWGPKQHWKPLLSIYIWKHLEGDYFHFCVNYPFKSVVLNRDLKMTSNN